MTLTCQYPRPLYVGASSRGFRAAAMRPSMHRLGRQGFGTIRYGGVRCMASGNNKSWSEITGEAIQLVKTAASKVVDSVSETASKLLPGQDDSARPSNRGENTSRNVWGQSRGPLTGRDSVPENIFGGGMGGFVLGRLFNGVIGAAAKEMEKQGASSAKMKEQALNALDNDPRVESALGKNLRILDGMNFSSSSSTYTGGQMRKIVSTTFLVTGSHGSTAQVSVSSQEDNDGKGDLEINAQLPNGRVLSIDGNPANLTSSSDSRKPIDVEWREVR